MTANVFMIIIPNQKIVVADLKAGRAPDAKYGRIAKLRSTHNNYLTLPVIFLMLSNHYPLSFATEYNWLIASLVFLMGVTIRHYFNTMHAGKGRPHWTWAVTAVIFIAIMWLSTLQAPLDQSRERARLETELPRSAFTDHRLFPEVSEVVAARCAACHAKEPVWAGVPIAPKNVILESQADILRQAPRGLSSGGPVARNAAGQHDLHGSRRTAANCPVVPGVGAKHISVLGAAENRAGGPARRRFGGGSRSRKAFRPATGRINAGPAWPGKGLLLFSGR